MLIKLLLLFTGVPFLELAILIEIGRRAGLLPTLTIVILTGVIGAFLAKSQGFEVLRRIRDDLSKGVFPADHIFEGILILTGGLLLLTPGLLTDIVGFLTLIPFTRQLIKNALRRKVRSIIDSRVIRTDFHTR